MDEVARSADRVDLILELLDVRLAERLLVLLQRTMRLVQSPRPLLEPLRDRPLQPIDGGGARRVDHLLPGALLLDGVAHGTRQLLAHLALLLVEEAIDPLRLREPRCVGAAAPCGVGSRDDLQHDLRIGSLERVGIPLHLLEAGLDGGLVLGEPAPLDRQPVRIPGGVGRLSRGGHRQRRVSLPRASRREQQRGDHQSARRSTNPHGGPLEPCARWRQMESSRTTRRSRARPQTRPQRSRIRRRRRSRRSEIRSAGQRRSSSTNSQSAMSCFRSNIERSAAHTRCQLISLPSTADVSAPDACARSAATRSPAVMSAVPSGRETRPAAAGRISWVPSSNVSVTIFAPSSAGGAGIDGSREAIGELFGSSSEKGAASSGEGGAWEGPRASASGGAGVEGACAVGGSDATRGAPGAAGLGAAGLGAAEPSRTAALPWVGSAPWGSPEGTATCSGATAICADAG